MKPSDFHPAVYALASEAWESSADEVYRAVGELLEQGNTVVASQVEYAVWNKIEGLEFQPQDLLLECLACYGHAHFQPMIDKNVVRALYARSEYLVFCALASWSDLSKELRALHFDRVRELSENHDSESVRRAATAILKT